MYYTELTFYFLSSTSVIYHYSVIVEMFCIGLYARHTFRKVEPSVEEDFTLEARPIRDQLLDKAVQTEDVLTSGPPHSPRMPSDGPWPGQSFPGTSNLGYNSDSEDSLCKIEHAPLDGFPFPRQPTLHDSARPGTVMDLNPARETGCSDLAKITVTADINYDESKDVTVV